MAARATAPSTSLRHTSPIEAYSMRSIQFSLYLYSYYTVVMLDNLTTSLFVLLAKGQLRLAMLSFVSSWTSF